MRKVVWWAALLGLGACHPVVCVPVAQVVEVNYDPVLYTAQLRVVTFMQSEGYTCVPGPHVHNAFGSIVGDTYTCTKPCDS